MKKWSLVLAIAVLALVFAAGCASARQGLISDNLYDLRYDGADTNGSHRYTSNLGEYIWLGNGEILLDGARFAGVSGNTGRFTFPDGRVLSAEMDGQGELRSVTVTPTTEVHTTDYPRMEAALLVYHAERSLAAGRSTATTVTVIIMLALAAAAVFAVKPLLALLNARNWLHIPNSDKIVLYSRIGGIALAVIALIIIIIALF